MEFYRFLVYKKSFYVIIILMFMTNLASGVQSGNSSSCIPRNCSNGFNIRYPFWIQGLQEASCGLPGYTVTCHNKHPMLKIWSDDYIIKDIVYENNSLVLVNSEVYDDANKCPSPRYNFSVKGTPFMYGPKTKDLYFFYNCTSRYAMATYDVDCASNATHHYAFAVFHKEILDHNNYSARSCLPWVNAPVEIDSLNRLLEMTYTDILKKGFVVQWNGVNCSDFPKKGGLNVPRKIAIVFGAAVFGALLMSLVFFIYHCKFKKCYRNSSIVSREIFSNTNSASDLDNLSNYHGAHVFHYEELKEATNNFDSTKEVGDGGFGIVYKGKLRDGRVVAIKRLYDNNYKRVEQFMNEVELLTRLKHQNLVSLYGCTSYLGRELLLVYEHIPNGTVADHLHGELAKPGLPSWTTRLNIAIETASALVYLHASDVIHRDVKTNNILLDNNFSVRVADFGLSRNRPINVTHISTAPQGTPGYVDPEYHQSYHLTDKSDVYSFGVVLIELISSKPAVDITRHSNEINLSNMAIMKIQNDALHELVDLNLGYTLDPKVRSMINMVADLAFRCLQVGREMRPSMKEVLEILQGTQTNYSSLVKAEEMDIPSDDVILLKNSSSMSLKDDVSG